MSSLFVTQTRMSEIRLVDPAMPASRERLMGLARAHLDPEEIANVDRLFADPERVRSGDGTDWYTDVDGEPGPLGDLPEAARGPYLDQVGAICARLRALADRLEQSPESQADARFLRAAISVPDNERYVFAIGDQAVLVGWAHRPGVEGAAAVPAGRWVEQRRQDEPPRAAPSAGAATGAALGAAGAVPVRAPTDATILRSGVAAPFPWLAWLLWAVFLLLLAIILYLMLSACSAGLPRTALAERLGLWARCPLPVAAAQTPIREAEAESAALRQAIREAELALARDAQECRIERIEEAERRAAAIPPEPAPQPEVPETDEAMDDLDERIEDAGGSRGAVQVILTWDGPADLDLSVSCGSETISYNSEQGCAGGELDVDANYDVDMDRPVENIQWGTPPPPGTYDVSVRNPNNNGDPRAEIPFEVTIREGDEVTRHRGAVRPGGRVEIPGFRIQ